MAISFDEKMMCHALLLADRAALEGEVPVGAVAVVDDNIVGEGWNRPIQSCDPSAHAEVIALREAGVYAGNYRLNPVTLYVTLEPCMMCVGAIIHARINRLVYAAPDKKAGAIQGRYRLLNHPLVNHKVEITSGVLCEEASIKLKHFFQSKRVVNKC